MGGGAHPILPSLNAAFDMFDVTTGVYDADTFSYMGAYDGSRGASISMHPVKPIMFINPVTMFAVRISTPDVVFLTPLLRNKQDMLEFLTMRIVEASNMEVSKAHVDRFSRRWWSTQVGSYIEFFFGHKYRHLIHRITWSVDTISQWILGWMNHINSLCWEEWHELDVDLQRLYVLLDHGVHTDAMSSITHTMIPIPNRSAAAVRAAPRRGNWLRILKHPKYSEWVAKVVVFTTGDLGHRCHFPDPVNRDHHNFDT